MHLCMNIFSKHIDNVFPLLIIVGIGITLSAPVLSQPTPGVDAPMHLSKISRLWPFFPSLPAWFPWWYCGTPLLKTYPPLMYVTDISVAAILHLEPWLALGITDTVCFVLTGCFIFLFLRKIGLHELACLSSAIFYLSSFQTLSGRFGYGHYTHTFAMFVLVFGIYLVAKTHSSKHYEILLAGIVCLLFLSHLSVALCFVGLMLAYYIGASIAKLIDAKNEKNQVFPFGRSLIGGTIGVLLSSFWAVPYLIDGGPGATAFMGSAAQYMPPLQSLFMFDTQNIWLNGSYYLGIPLIVFGILGLLVSVYRRDFWGIIFTFWAIFFLFMCVQPIIFQGLSIGYPARYLFFFSFPLSLLSGIALHHIFRKFSGRFPKLSLKILSRSLLVLLLFGYAVSVSPVVVKSYELDNIVAGELNQYLGPYERLASISTFSYAFNVLSNRFQIDGGYIEGNINLQFYRMYWNEIYSGQNTEATINILKKLNARLVLFHGTISPELEQKFVPPYFSVVLREPPITVYELNRTLVPLNFVEVNGSGDGGSLSYTNPDNLEFTLANCSENTELLVKMNYHNGWTAYCNDEVLPLVRNEEGFMTVLVPFEGDVKIRLQYGSTLIDHIGFATTIAGALMCVFLLLRKSSRVRAVAKFFGIRKKL